MSRARISLGICCLLGLALSGCAPDVNSFVRSDVDYSYIRQVAVFPFQNLSQDLYAAARVQSVFTTQLLAQDGLRVVEPGAVLATLEDQRLDAAAELSPDQIVALGEQLGADAIFFGTVEEYGAERMSNDRVYLVTLSFALHETETGSLIWQGQVHNDGTSFWRKLFGGGSASLYQVTSTAVDDALETLFQ